MPLLSKIKRNISMKKDNHTEEIIFLGILIIPVIWIALLIAPFIHKGLFNAMDDISNAFDNPFSITWCSDSLRTVAIFLLFYLLGVGIYLSSLRNYRKKKNMDLLNGEIQNKSIKNTLIQNILKINYYPKTFV